MAYYHGTTNHRFREGDVVLPGREVGTWSNWTVFDENLRRELASGRVVHPQEVVWLTPDPAAALDWAAHSTLKALPHEIRGMAAGGLAVYEVEPVTLDHPTDPHGDGEACCARARVIREVSFEPFPLDDCDVCGEKATEGIGSDRQLCGDCKAEEVAA